MQIYFKLLCFLWLLFFVPFGTNAAITLQSPYVAKAGVFKGQMHVHSKCAGGCSDGSQPPAAVAAAYRDAGYDFISITDHNLITPDPKIAGILFIGGIEDTKSDGHLNRINATKATVSSLQGVIDLALSEGSFVFLNHPNWPGGYPANPIWTDARIDSVRNYHAIEVWNSVVGPNNQNTESRIDRLLSEGKRFYLVANDDCHDVASAYCKTASVKVFSDNLTIADIMANLKSGNFYASSGANISRIEVLNQTIRINTDAASKIEFIGDQGMVLQSGNGITSADYAVKGNEKYIRARVVRNSDGKMAWTNPIYVSGTPDNLPPVLFLDPTPSDNLEIYGNNLTIKTDFARNTLLLDWNNSLAGWWRFDNAGKISLFSDSSGRGNNMSCDGEKCPKIISGKYGNASLFDGADCLSAGSGFGDGIDALTVSAWVYSTAGGYALSFLAKDNLQQDPQDPNRSWYFGLNDSQSFKVALWTNNGRYDVVADGLNLNEWSNLAFVYDGSGIKLYKNGIMVANKPATGVINKTAASVRIGCINNNYYFKGGIDDARIYLRALSGEEIKSAYDSTQNQLTANFSLLTSGDYVFQAYSQDYYGNISSTEKRNIQVINSVCAPNAVSGCKVCKSDGTGWVDDNSKCAANQTCQNGSCVNNSVCSAKTCASLGNYQCGDWSDGCGKTINCGSCASGRTCNNGQCVSSGGGGGGVIEPQKEQPQKMTRAEILQKIAQIKQLLVQLIVQLIAELQKQLAATR